METVLEPSRKTVTDDPPNAEAPLADLLDEVSGPGRFYVRCNFTPPELDLATWRLRVGGAVERPLELGLDALRARPSRTVRVTLECAGNGRTLVEPVAPGTPWGLGAVSTARFTGTPLADLLAEAGAAPGAVEVAFRGADAGEVEPGRRVAFERSLPLAAARHPDTLLVWEMDGQPLALEHGRPLRLLVPGWYGVASVKWLTDVRVLEEPFTGHFQVERYVYQGEGGTPEDEPVREMRVRSLVATPADGAVLADWRPGDGVSVAGAAWSGAGGARRVEISTDGGASWADAEWLDPPDPHTARRWRYTWVPPTAGRYTLLSRATDAAGHRQPAAGRWNRLGYGNNGMQAVVVTVGGRPA